MSRRTKVLLLVVLFLVIAALTRPGENALFYAADKDVWDTEEAFFTWWATGVLEGDASVLGHKYPVAYHNHLFFSTLTLYGKVRAVGFFGLSLPVGK